MTTEPIRCPIARRLLAYNTQIPGGTLKPDQIIVDATAAIDALVEALKPFAVAANDAHVRNCECEEALVGAGGLTAGDLRHASVVLERLGVKL